MNLNPFTAEFLQIIWHLIIYFMNWLQMSLATMDIKFFTSVTLGAPTAFWNFLSKWTVILERVTYVTMPEKRDLVAQN